MRAGNKSCCKQLLVGCCPPAGCWGLQQCVLLSMAVQPSRDAVKCTVTPRGSAWVLLPQPSALLLPSPCSQPWGSGAASAQP